MPLGPSAGERREGLVDDLGFDGEEDDIGAIEEGLVILDDRSADDVGEDSRADLETSEQRIRSASTTPASTNPFAIAEAMRPLPRKPTTGVDAKGKTPSSLTVSAA